MGVRAGMPMPDLADPLSNDNNNHHPWCSMAQTKATTAKKVTDSLKSRAPAKDRSLLVRLGLKKHVLPFEARILTAGEFAFVHIPASAQLMKVTDSGLQPITDAEAVDAAKAFDQRSKNGKSQTAVEISAQLNAALATIPKGFKLKYEDGSYRVAKIGKPRK